MPEQAQISDSGPPEPAPLRSVLAVLWAMTGLYAVAIVVISLLIVFDGEGQSASAADPNPTTVPQAIGDPGAGQLMFTRVCSVCHGPDGHGLPGLGKSFVDNVFVAANSDEELVAFIEMGRPPGDPANTTGVAMPPKGGNPALSETDLYDIVAFVRTIS